MKKTAAGKKFGKKLSLNKERVRELSADELKNVQGASDADLCGNWGNQTGACVSTDCLGTRFCPLDQ